MTFEIKHPGVYAYKVEVEMTIEDAIKFVVEAFGSRKDRGGDFYFNHCIRVMKNLPEDVSDDVRCAALLHDVLEDLPQYTGDDLVKHGCSRRTVYLVKRLTHKPEVHSYEQYIRELATSGDRELILIKLADNLDNSDPDRLMKSSPEFREFAFKRYLPAREALERALEAW